MTLFTLGFPLTSGVVWQPLQLLPQSGSGPDSPCIHGCYQCKAGPAPARTAWTVSSVLGWRGVPIPSAAERCTGQHLLSGQSHCESQCRLMNGSMPSSPRWGKACSYDTVTSFLRHGQIVTHGCIPPITHKLLQDNAWEHSPEI